MRSTCRLYVTTIGIGTPPQPVSVQIDTGQSQIYFFPVLQLLVNLANSVFPLSRVIQSFGQMHPLYKSRLCGKPIVSVFALHNFPFETYLMSAKPRKINQVTNGLLRSRGTCHGILVCPSLRHSSRVQSGFHRTKGKAIESHHVVEGNSV